MKVKTIGSKKGKYLLVCGTILLLLAFIGGLCVHHYKTEGPVILMYHHLAPAGTYTGTPDEENGAILAVETFEEQMKWLADNQYNTMLLSEVEPYLLEQKALPPKTVIITFDDGYESNFVYAFEILKKYQLKANFAIVVRDSERRNENPDTSPYADNTLRHMTFRQARTMSESGLIEIGSHSYNGHGQVNVNEKGETKPFFVYKSYNTVTKVLETQEEYVQRITEDLKKSRQVLNEKIGKESTYLAYPYGLHDETILAAAKSAGFHIGLIIKNDVIHPTSDPLRLPRHSVEPTMTLEEFIDLVSYKAQ